MIRPAAALALVLVLLSGVASARAAVVGANDDAAKFEPDAGASLYRDMVSTGLRQTVIGVRFRPSEPIVMQDKALLERAIPTAVDAGLRVVLAVYPYPTREIELGLGRPHLFGAYVQALAREFPEVRTYVIGNEPNQPAFWRPQFSRSGANVSAASFGPYLAAAYDALKDADAGIEVVGIGLSPRGNDKPKARSNISTSPIRFLRALGAWYRRSGRSRPLMDSFSFHPYPNRATDPLDVGYPWPNAGFVNLDRVKQALWDAFRGTPQPTTTQGLTIHLDEVGWQVNTSWLSGYQGAENVPVTNEPTQASIYADLIRRAACDADVSSVSFFGFRDDGLRTGFQAGLVRADGTPRPAVGAVRAAIAEAAFGCSQPQIAWISAEDVLGAQAEVLPGGSRLRMRLRAGEDARARFCVRSLAVRGIGGAVWRSLGAGARCATASLRGLRALAIALPVPAGDDVRAQIEVSFTAVANTSRTTVVSVTAPVEALVPRA